MDKKRKFDRIPRLSSEWEALFADDEQQIDAFLVNILSSYSSGEGPSTEYDRFVGLGTQFARHGREGKDAIALQWLASKPIPKRLDLASAFLRGIWLPAFRKSPVNPQAVQSLVNLRSIVPHDDNASYSSLLALSAVADALGEAAAVARQALLDASNERFVDKSFQHQVETMISKYGRDSHA